MVHNFASVILMHTDRMSDLVLKENERLIAVKNHEIRNADAPSRLNLRTNFRNFLAKQFGYCKLVGTGHFDQKLLPFVSIEFP
ncbi:hypothetical protein D2V07_11700 [Aurantiacibacter zhengii]|uniref:Uncharacterized protein n=1 Tax=Aurantiacibacter zhengii TaxID=2307003 RepID=A0A418NSD6_9SPHN|nr:hypothetical protein D2V07_11700 [Aurantiacibacter zhengii]